MSLPYGPEPHDVDAFTAGTPAPHTPPMDVHAAARLAAARLGLHPVPHQAELIEAVVARRMAELSGVDVDSPEWWPFMDREQDVADMYLAHRVETFDIPGRAS